MRFANWLFNRLQAHIAGRAPDQIIGEPNSVYLRRWWLTPFRGWSAKLKDDPRLWARALDRINRMVPNLYLHKFERSDDESFDAAISGAVLMDRNKRSVWTIPTHPTKEAHFATFPEALVEPCIRAGSRPGDTVLDPFIGSGTVGLVAEREGRQWIGIELKPENGSMSERRVRGAQKPLQLGVTG